jgi:hypothetical protein
MRKKLTGELRATGSDPGIPRRMVRTKARAPAEADTGVSKISYLRSVILEPPGAGL